MIFFYFDPVYLNTKISWKYNIFINLQNTFSNVIYGVQTDDMNTVSLYEIDFFCWWLDGLCLILRPSLYVQMYLFRQDYCSMSVQLFLLSKNGMESMKKLSTFLGTSTDPKFLQAVYDTCSIEEVKKRLKSPIDVIFYRKGNLQNFKTIVNFCWSSIEFLSGM